MKPSEYLRRGFSKRYLARDALNNPTLCRVSNDEIVSVCFYGAILLTGFNSRKEACFIRAAEKYLHGTRIVEWNDAPDRTQAEAVELAEKVEAEWGIK